MNKFMMALWRKLREGRTETTADQLWRTLMRLRDEVHWAEQGIMIPERFTDLKWLEDVSEIKRRIEAISDSNNTRWTHYKNIMAVWTTVGNSDMNAKYRQLFDSLNEPIVEHYKSGKKSAKQEEQMIPWAKVLEVRDKLRDDPDKQEHYLMLCLYTMIPPLRSDFSEMVCASNMGAIDATHNWYVFETREIVLNVFKNAKDIGQQVIQIPEELATIIESRKKPGDPMLCSPNTKTIWNQSRVCREMEIVFGQRMGPTMLRHIYITDTHGPHISKMAQDAKSMCHSLNTQKEYVRQ